MNYVLQPPPADHPLASAGDKGSSLHGETRGHRSDGMEARNRLLDAALVLFGEKGFAKTSTREIAQAAQVNIAAISYYFGDKAGLYRAVFIDQRCNPHVPPETLGGQYLSLQQVLTGMMRGFVEPLKQGHLMQQCMKLHFREMLEPTGVWQEEIDSNIKPAHMALVNALCRHLAVTEPDDDIHRLAFSMAGLGMMLHVAGDVFSAIRPQLVASHEALDQYGDRLVTYAMALAEEEGRRRAGLAICPGLPNASRHTPVSMAKPVTSKTRISKK
jgi:TetR/AcrR family transcriptional regulator, regulator of cefoperazone and chloramphenicol sensitivity